MPPFSCTVIGFTCSHSPPNTSQPTWRISFFALSTLFRRQGCKPLTDKPLDVPSLETVDPTRSPIFGGPSLLRVLCHISAHARFSLTGDRTIVVYLCTLLLTAIFGHD